MIIERNGDVSPENCGNVFNKNLWNPSTDFLKTKF